MQIFFNINDSIAYIKMQPPHCIITTLQNDCVSYIRYSLSMLNITTKLAFQILVRERQHEQMNNIRIRIVKKTQRMLGQCSVISRSVFRHIFISYNHGSIPYISLPTPMNQTQKFIRFPNWQLHENRFSAPKTELKY